MVLSIDTIHDRVNSLAPNYDIERIYLFGSYAKGCATNESDIDICIESSSSFSLFQAGEFAYKLRGILGKQIDLASPSSLYPFVKNNYESDKVMIYERA